MNDYERLESEACDDGIDVIDCSFESERIKGLYCDSVIGINKNLKCSEKVCILAEELGHHYTTSGNIIDQSKVENRKQEHTARLYAYRKMITLDKLAAARQNGCRNRYEIAEHLEVIEEFLQAAIDSYKSIYGSGYHQHGDYLICFEPLNIIYIELQIKRKEGII